MAKLSGIRHDLWRASSFVGVMPPSTYLDSCRGGGHGQGPIGARALREKGRGQPRGQGQDEAKASQAVSQCLGPGQKHQGGTKVYINHWFCVYMFSYVHMFPLYMYAPGRGGATAGELTWDWVGKYT